MRIGCEASGQQGIAYASRRKVSPFSVRKVHLDERSEQKIWSSLVLSYAQLPEILVQGITRADLSYLEDLIVQNLNALENPIQPTIAVSTPPAFRLLAAHLKEYGRVIKIDLDRLPRIPPETDLLFWIQPGRITPEHLREFQRTWLNGSLRKLAFPVNLSPSTDQANLPMLSIWICGISETSPLRPSAQKP